MRTRSIAFCLVAVAAMSQAAPAMAQGMTFRRQTSTDMPKGDLAVSYSVLYDKELPSEIPGVSGWMPTGFVVAGAGHVTHNLFLVGEVGGNYKPLTYLGVDVTVNVYSFLGGMRYAPRVNPRVTPFMQILFGVARYSANAMGSSASINGFATQVGAGVDIGVSNKLAVRLQGDYRANRSSDSYGNQFRLATGIVCKF